METYNLEIYKESFSRILVKVQASSEEEAKNKVKEEYGDDVEFIDIYAY